MESYTYPLHRAYGGDEIQKQNVAIESAEVSPSGKRVRLRCTPLRPFFVHELHYPGVRSAEGEEPWHSAAFYTLNRIPER